SKLFASDPPSSEVSERAEGIGQTSNTKPPAATSPARSAAPPGRMTPAERSPRATPTLAKAASADHGACSRAIRSGLATMPMGIRYRTRPRAMAVTDTLSQYSLTMPAAMNTAPQTGGVMVDSRAYQNTKR